MKKLLCLILSVGGLTCSIGLYGEERKEEKEILRPSLILKKIAEKIKNAFPDKEFYDHGGVLDEIGFFTKEFTWQEQWGDKDAPYISIFGVKYTRHEYYKMIYEAILHDYGHSGLPREYWPKFVPHPVWEGLLTRERDPKARVPWVQRKRELWEEYHCRERTPYEIGKLQAKIVWWYCVGRDRRDDKDFIGSHFVREIVVGYDPLIFARPEVFDGAKRWSEKVLAMPKNKVSDDDLTDAEAFMRKYREGIVDRLPKSKEEMEKEREESDAAVREGMRWVEERKASRTPEEIERDRIREEELRERDRVQKAEMDELANDFPKLMRKAIDELRRLPNPTEEQQMAIEEAEKSIREYNEVIAEAEKAKTRPKEGDIFNYRMARSLLLEDPSATDDNKLKDIINDIETRFPEMKATVKDVVVQLMYPDIADWAKYEQQKIVVVMEPRDTETTVTARKPCKVTARGHLKFALFDDYKNFKIGVKPTPGFPFSGKAEWSWDEIGVKPLLFNLESASEPK